MIKSQNEAGRLHFTCGKHNYMQRYFYQQAGMCEGINSLYRKFRKRQNFSVNQGVKS